MFQTLDRPALKPLPAEPCALSEWSRARVNIDYHVSFDDNFYSVPYNLVQELVEIRSTPTTVELHKGTRVASHPRDGGRGHFERIMSDKPHPEMGYRGCLGIIRLAGKSPSTSGVADGTESLNRAETRTMLRSLLVWVEGRLLMRSVGDDPVGCRAARA